MNEKIIQQVEVLKMCSLSNQYKELQLSNGLEVVKGYINKKLIKNTVNVSG